MTTNHSMDARFFVQEETHRIVLPNDQWVDVKKEMSLADWDRLESSAITVVAGETNVGRYHRSSIDLLEINTLAWSFDVPLTRGSIGKLNRRTSDLIVAEIEKLNLTPKERAVKGTKT